MKNLNQHHIFVAMSLCLILSLPLVGEARRGSYNRVDIGREKRPQQVEQQIAKLFAKMRIPRAVQNRIVRNAKREGLKPWPLLRSLQSLNKARRSRRKFTTDAIVVYDYTRPVSKNRGFIVDLRSGNIDPFQSGNARGRYAGKRNDKQCESAFGNGSGVYLKRQGAFCIGPQPTPRRRRKTYEAIGLNRENMNAAGQYVQFHELKKRSGARIGNVNYRNIGCMVSRPRDFQKITRLKERHGDNTCILAYAYPAKKDIVDNPYWDKTCARNLNRRGKTPLYYEKARNVTHYFDSRVNDPKLFEVASVIGETKPKGERIAYQPTTSRRSWFSNFSRRSSSPPQNSSRGFSSPWTH